MDDNVENIQVRLNTLWTLLCTQMIFMAQVGYMMKETGTIKMQNNNVVLLKTILVISVSFLTFFMIGFGFSVKAQGGLFGDANFFGVNITTQEYLMFIFYVSLCVKMAVIATGAIAERTNISTYIFFSFINSGFIFPVGLAWCWSDGWLENMGFIDIGGAGVVHIMGGIAGFFGTLLIGPRIGLFRKDEEMEYVLDEELILDDALLYISSKKEEKSRDESKEKIERKESMNRVKFGFENEGLLVDNKNFERLVHKIALDMIKKDFDEKYQKYDAVFLDKKEKEKQKEEAN
jgi:ammonia channel protein AmtB